MNIEPWASVGSKKSGISGIILEYFYYGTVSFSRKLLHLEKNYVKGNNVINFNSRNLENIQLKNILFKLFSFRNIKAELSSIWMKPLAGEHTEDIGFENRRFDDAANLLDIYFKQLSLRNWDICNSCQIK